MALHTTDHWAEFIEKNNSACDMALGLMAIDIERLGKQKAPVKYGHLYSSIHHQRLGIKHFKVAAGEDGPSMAYARFQEFGGDRTRTVRHYTKAGTGAHFLRDSGDTVYKKTKEYFNTALAAHGLK